MTNIEWENLCFKELKKAKADLSELHQDFIQNHLKEYLRKYEMQCELKRIIAECQAFSLALD